jgi:hypothetical protein
MSLLCCHCPPPDSGVNLTSIIGLIVAVAAIIITLYAIYAAKRVEISANKFNKLCIEPIEAKLKILDDLFETKRLEEIHNHLSTITDITGDLALLCVELKKVYPKLDVNALQESTYILSDAAYANSSYLLFFVQSEFLKMKIDIFDKVYTYALYKEVKFLSRRKNLRIIFLG